jgi:hypothetical protein
MLHDRPSLSTTFLKNTNEDYSVNIKLLSHISTAVTYQRSISPEMTLLPKWSPLDLAELLLSLSGTKPRLVSEFNKHADARDAAGSDLKIEGATKWSPDLLRTYCSRNVACTLGAVYAS